MKKIFIVLIFVFISLSVFGSKFALTDDGKKIDLNENNHTWKESIFIPVSIPDIPNEETLYNYAFYDNGTETSKYLSEKYFQAYEGINLEHTINMLYKNSHPYEDDYEAIMMKGITYSEKLGKYYDIPDYWYIDCTSNLYFLYGLANYYESNGFPQNALFMYEKLKKVFIETGEKFYYGGRDCSLTEIEGKIYALKLIINKN